MATIDDIRIKLGVDATDVARGVKSAFTSFDAELRKARKAQVTLSIVEKSTTEKDIDRIRGKIAQIGVIPISIQTGDISAAAIAQKITQDLKQLPGGGVPVPVRLDTELTERDAAATKKAIEKALADNKVIVTVDWQFAAEPKGGWPKGGGPGATSPGGPAGGGGPGGGGPTPTGSGPRTSPRSPGPTAAGEARSAAPTERDPEQRANDQRLRKAMADAAKAKKAGDDEAQRKAEEEANRARAERDRMAKERRAAATSARKAAAQDAKQRAAAERAQAETQGETPETPTTVAGGLGGSRARARSAARATPPTGKPAGDVPIKNVTTLEGVERPAPRRGATNLGAPEKGAFVGKGKSKNFRPGFAPRNPLAAGQDLTPEGTLRAELGLPLREQDIVATVAAGETPATDPVSKWQRILNNLKIERGHREGLQQWAGEMQAAGVGGMAGAMSEDDARAILRTLKPGQRRRIYEQMGLPSTIGEAVGGAMDPLKRPEIVAAVQALLNIPAERFDEAVDVTGGGIVNVNAGARKGGKATGGGQITGGAVEQGQKQKRMSLAARAKELAKRDLENISQKEDVDKPVVAPKVVSKKPVKSILPPELRGGDDTPWSMENAQRIREDFERSEAELLGPRALSLGEVSGPIPTVGTRGPARPAGYENAYAQAAEARYARLFTRARRSAGLPGLTTDERRRALEEFRIRGRQRPRSTAENPLYEFAEGGLMHAEEGRIHHTWKWRQMSLRQRAFQPFCTYCGTFGSAKNPLQGEHFNPVSKGGAPFDPRNVTTSCKNCNLQKGKAVGWGPPGRAEGGEVKHTGLLGRMVSRGTYTGQLPPGFSVTQVGERGPELIVQSPNGEAEVIPTHQVPTWIARMQQGKLEGKDLTGRAAGGTLGGGPFQFRGVSGSLSANDPLLSRGTVQGGNINRVFVVNWPTAMTGRVTGARPISVTATTPTGRPLTTQAASGTRQPGGGGGGVAPAPNVANPQGPAPGAAGLAGAQPSDFFLPGSDPALQAQLKIARQRRIGLGRFEAQQERAQLAIVQAENPVRAFTTSVSQVFQTLAGRGELTKAVKQTQEALAQQQQAIGGFQTAKGELQEAVMTRNLLRERAKTVGLTPEQTEELGKATRDLPRLSEAVKFWRKEVTRAGAETENATHKLGGMSQAFRNLAVGGVSATLAGVGIGVAFTAFNAAMELGTKVIGDVVERTGGYRNATAELGKALGEQTRQLGGNAGAAVAAAEAAANLSDIVAKRLTPALTGRAEGLAASAAAHEQLILTSSARNISQQNQGLPPGFDASLIRGTGGPFDLGLLPGILSTRSLADELNLSLQQGFGGGGQKFGDPISQFLSDTVNTALGGGMAEIPGENAFKAIEDLGAAFEKGGGAPGGLNFLPVNEFMNQDTVAKTKAASDTAIAAFESLGDDGKKLAATFKTMQEHGVALVGPTNRSEAAAILETIKRGLLTPDVGTLIQRLTSPIGGQGGLSPLDTTLRDITRRGAFQRQTQLPAAQALAFAAQPIVPFSEARLRPSGTLPGDQFKDNEGTIAQYQKAFENYAKFAEPAQARINAQIEKGRETLKGWIGPDLLKDITDLGKNIQGIQLGINQRSLNLEVSQYNNEIRVANRQLGIAKDFSAAIKGNVHATIGGMQGENYQLSRQLQLLSFQVQQRQINLQLALAGFQTPGETSEERQARRADAEAQAQLAQQQLDLQKKVSGNEYAVGLKENANAITDLSAQIALLREGKALAIDSTAAQEAIKAMTAELEILQQEAQSRFDDQVKMSDVQLGIITDIERQTGQVFDTWQNKLYPAWRKAGKEAGAAATDFVIGAITEALMGGTGQVIAPQFGGKAKPGGGTVAATGLLFDTSGPTNLTVGEAGTETVAILRNPRPMQMPQMGSGSGQVVNIVFNNTQVRNDGDLEAIVRKVEEALNRRTQLIGLR